MYFSSKTFFLVLDFFLNIYIYFFVVVRREDARSLHPRARRGLFLVWKCQIERKVAKPEGLRCFYHLRLFFMSQTFFFFFLLEKKKSSLVPKSTRSAWQQNVRCPRRQKYYSETFQQVFIQIGPELFFFCVLDFLFFCLFVFCFVFCVWSRRVWSRRVWGEDTRNRACK